LSVPRGRPHEFEWLEKLGPDELRRLAEAPLNRVEEAGALVLPEPMIDADVVPFCAAI
jgi:hypothetical protein